MRNKFFTRSVTKHWNRLTKKIVESPLEILKICLNTILGNVLYGTLPD